MSLHDKPPGDVSFDDLTAQATSRIEAQLQGTTVQDLLAQKERQLQSMLEPRPGRLPPRSSEVAPLREEINILESMLRRGVMRPAELAGQTAPIPVIQDRAKLEAEAVLERIRSLSKRANEIGYKDMATINAIQSDLETLERENSILRGMAEDLLKAKAVLEEKRKSMLAESAAKYARRSFPGDYSDQEAVWD